MLDDAKTLEENGLYHGCKVYLYEPDQEVVMPKKKEETEEKNSDDNEARGMTQEVKEILKKAAKKGKVTVYNKSPNNPTTKGFPDKYEYIVTFGQKIANFKRLISMKGLKIRTENQMLIFRGKLMRDDLNLAS